MKAQAIVTAKAGLFLFLSAADEWGVWHRNHKYAEASFPSLNTLAQISFLASGQYAFT